MVQKSRQLELSFTNRGESPGEEPRGQAFPAASVSRGSGTGSLMEEALSRPNLKRAWTRVKRNGGSPGIDGMTVDQLLDWLWEHWPRTREDLLAGRYRPQPVLRVEIPKRGGGKRNLGIPTVVDRLIQQALLQVLQVRFDPTFSEHSHGFRPGRRAHDAIREARQYVQGGKSWVVDVDLEKFFDRVNHDVLMGRLAKRIEDRRVLRLIRRYLEAGVMADGVVLERHEGTPQGGPLSPLLANVLLDEVDRELERRGHCFVRYADDLRVFVGSKKAGDRVMRSLIGVFGRLRLRVNESKSAVDKAWKRPFLGLAFWVGRGRRIGIRVSGEALRELKHRVRLLTKRMRGRSLRAVVEELRGYLLGWKAYFRLAETPRVFRLLDEWVRHRLRAYQLKQWKRGPTVFRKLRSLGLSVDGAARVAGNARRWWHNSSMLLHSALANSYLAGLGLPNLAS
ncbi:MAG TPA: group II intron reverse transcriptase/maturase [Spirochaetia bacterium]|nr:group II intron reverse transcriptase/maturase [Spirochaetia bacterium]